MSKIVNGINEVTNGQYREIEYLYRNDNFELVEWNSDTMDDETESIACFKYKGDYIGLDEVMRASDECPHDGYMGFSYFNGIYVDFNESNDGVKVTYFYS